MNAHVWWVTTALFLVLTPLAKAKTYVVNQRHPTAADRNVGTEEKPFATITAAARLVKPGDEVIVRGGVYREKVVVEADIPPEHILAVYPSAVKASLETSQIS